MLWQLFQVSVPTYYTCVNKFLQFYNSKGVKTNVILHAANVTVFQLVLHSWHRWMDTRSIITWRTRMQHTIMSEWSADCSQAHRRQRQCLTNLLVTLKTVKCRQCSLEGHTLSLDASVTRHLSTVISAIPAAMQRQKQNIHHKFKCDSKQQTSV